MANFSGIYSPDGRPVTNATLATITSTAEILMGKNRLFVIQATDDFHIAFGSTGMGAAAATDWKVVSGSPTTFTMPSGFQHIRIYNPTANTITYQIMPLAFA